MEFLDWIVIACYFVLIVGIAWWAGRNQRTTGDYFLAGRNVGWFAIGASIFTANIGSEHIVGLAGSGVSKGMAMAHWEMQAWILILLAYVFVPFYYKAGIYTIPEFLEKRFGARTRWLLSVVSLVAYVFTKVSVTVYAGAIVFQALLPDVFGSPDNAFWVGAFGTVIITGIYTVFGGMRAILYTSAPQAVLLILGSGIITYAGLDALGGENGGIFSGWGNLVDLASSNAEAFALWRPLSDPDLPWAAVLIASPIVGIWYWCTDQYIVQRTLSAENLEVARKGALFGGLLKLTPIFIFLIPGIIGWALFKKFPDRFPLALLPDGSINGDMVFPMLVKSLLPAGVRGLIVACLLAALMSSLASLFNSSASLFTVDIYEKLFPNKSEKHLLFVGRVATTVVVAAGIVWIPVMKIISSGGLYQYLQSVQGYLAPSITAVFIFGIFWRRTNEAGAVWGLMTGFVFGMLKLGIQSFFGFGADKISSPEILAFIGDFNPYYAAGVIFAFSSAALIAASLATAEPPKEKLKGLTYAWLMSDSEARAEIAKSWSLSNKILAASVFGGVAVCYLYFSFWLG